MHVRRGGQRIISGGDSRNFSGFFSHNSVDVGSLARGKYESSGGCGGAGVADDGRAGRGTRGGEYGLGEGGEGYHSEGADEDEAGLAHFGDGDEI